MDNFISGFVCGGAVFFLLGMYVEYRVRKSQLKEARKGLEDIQKDLDNIRGDLPAFLRKQAE